MQRLLLLILLTIFLIFSTNCFAEIKAVQISYLKVRNFKELEDEFIKIRKNGYNYVIFRVFHNKGDRFFPFIPKNKIFSKFGVYFNTKYIPCVNDCLNKVIELAHKHNLKLIAWMQTRYLDFGKFSKDRRVVKYNFITKKFEVAKGLSFFNKENYNFILNVYFDLLRYPIDGILFQDDLKVLIDEDFNPYAIKKFYEITKIKINSKNVNTIIFGNVNSRRKIKPTKYLILWEKLKENKIKNFLNFLCDNIKMKKDIPIFMNVGYEILLNSKLSRRWYGYNYDTLKNIKIDKFIVMMYQEQIKNELNISEQQLPELYKIMIRSCSNYGKDRFILKLQTYNWYENRIINFQKIESLWTFFKINNIKNIALFPYYKNMF